MTENKRLTYYSMRGSENDGWYLKPSVTREEAYERLADYEDIGTVFEFKQLKKKATAKKIGHCVFYREMGYGTPWQCLTCGADQTKVDFSCEGGSEPEEKHTFCWHCGQKLLWD